MELEYLTILEKRVEEMIELIKTLQDEKNSLAGQLREEEKAAQALHQERGDVRERVEKILMKINQLDDTDPNPAMEQETEQANSY